MVLWRARFYSGRACLQDLAGRESHRPILGDKAVRASGRPDFVATEKVNPPKEKSFFSKIGGCVVHTCELTAIPQLHLALAWLAEKVMDCFLE